MLPSLMRCHCLRAQASPDLPDVSFTCQNDGMLWYKEVLQRVPVKWAASWPFSGVEAYQVELQMPPTGYAKTALAVC